VWLYLLQRNGDRKNLSKGYGLSNNFAKVFFKKTDIDDKRVSGDTLSHLLFINFGAWGSLLGLPQFFSARMHVAEIYQQAAVFFQRYLKSPAPQPPFIFDSQYKFQYL
jgi:hypothetical protein